MINIDPASTGNQFRAKRVEILRSLVELSYSENGSCNLLDIGGTYGFWKTWENHFDWSKIRITCVNINPTHADTGRSKIDIEMVQGDARNLHQFADGHFDLIFSNSVIEHVGVWSDMFAMASEVRRLAKRYFVQTPYFWFPIEPHARTPLLHMLPISLGYRIVMARKCGYWQRAATVDEAMRTLESARLLDKRQFGALFPDADIISERFLGLTKSMFAIKR